MRCNWLRWLWGLLPLGLLVAYTYMNTREAIQADVAGRAASALQAAGLDWAGAKLDGRDATLVGNAYDAAEQVQATEILKTLYGVRVASNRSALIEKAEQYVWSARRKNGTIVLSGFVPSDRARRTILAEVKTLFPSTDVVDDMKPARGVPDNADWIGGVRFGLNQLSRLDSNSNVLLRNAQFEIAGRARSVADFRGVRGAINRDLPTGIQLASDKVRPAPVTPYTWDAQFDGSRVTLRGHAPSDAAKSQIVETAKAAFPSAAIVDRMQVASGQPDGWLEAATGLINSLSPLQTGSVKMLGTDIEVIGLAEREQTAREVSTSYETKLPRTFNVRHDIKFVKPTIPTVAPYLTQLDVDQTTVSLTGYVPNAARRQALLDAVARAFPGRRISDELQIALGQPKEWSTCLDQGLIGLGDVGNGRLRVRDRSIRLSGETSDEALSQELPGRLRAATSRTCETDIALRLNRAPEPNLQWSAVRSGDTLTLGGEVPDSETRNKLVDRAQVLFPNEKVVDQMRIVPGNGERWQEVSLTGLEMLARLRTGQATLNGQVLSVNGEAADAASASAIRQRLKRALATGYTGGGRVTVRSDSMIWAEREAARKSAELAAKRAEETERRRAEEQRLAALKAEQERERQRALREQRRREAEDRARQKAEADAAAAAEARRRADIAERARAERARRAAEERERARRAAREERRIQLRIARARCEAALEEVRSGGKINFEVGKADIARSSYRLLDGLSNALRRCESVTVDVEGHTDSQGTDENNLSLSQRRAAAVVSYLVDAGADPDQITARGFGESRPIASNETAAGRARNRRIEFVVKAGDGAQ
ncbi:MAG: OmpA family protein [Pseudomonadota bacterium]